MEREKRRSERRRMSGGGEGRGGGVIGAGEEEVEDEKKRDESRELGKKGRESFGCWYFTSQSLAHLELHAAAGWKDEVGEHEEDEPMLAPQRAHSRLPFKEGGRRL